MNLSSPFILRPVMTTLVMLAIATCGFFAFLHLPINDLPNIENPVIEISTIYTGAAPLTVLNQVTTPLEKELIHVKGVHEMSSYSSPGVSEITLSFDLSANMDEALRSVQSALNRIENELPSDVERPAYHLLEGGNESIIYILLNSPLFEKKELENYAEVYLTPKLSRIEGVAKVKVFGSPLSLWLKLNPEIMAARGIGFNQVTDTLKQHLAEKPLGSIQSGSKKIHIELAGSEENEKTLGELLIGNGPFKLKDIGEFVYQSKQEKEAFFVSSGQSMRTLLFGIQKVRGANTVAIAKNVEALITQMQKELPPSLELDLWFNKALWIEDAIQEVEWSLLFALLLVVLVIYVSLRKIREALIPSIALPFSLLGTLIIMYYAGYSLDLLSLLALTLSVGFVVDDAIVVVENIIRHQEKGKSPLKASLAGSKEISFTILSMTLSLVAVFIPLLFMGGMNGRLFREFSVTIAVAILVSGFISLTLTPLLCSRFLTISERPNQGRERISLNYYAKILKNCLKRPLPTLLLALGSIGITYILFTNLPLQLIPDEDRGFLMASVSIPTGTPPQDLQEQLNGQISENPAVKNFLNVRLDDKLLFLIRLKPERPPQTLVMQDLQKSLNQIPGVNASFNGYQMIHLDFDFGSTGRYKYILQGTNFLDVDNAAQALQQQLQASSLFSSVRSSETHTTPKLEIRIDEGKANYYGVTKQQIQELLGSAYGMSAIGYLKKGVTKTPVHTELLPASQKISKLSLTTKTGATIPLKLMADWEEKVGSLSLYHIDYLPAATLRFSFNEGISQSEGLKKMEKLSKAVLPANIKGKFTGSAKLMESSKREWLILLLWASLAMYAVLGILYESFIHPLTILSSLPFAGFGGVLTLYIFSEPLSLFSAVGFLLLIGIVKKNGIMIVDYALELQRKGITPEIAIYEACLVRFRPIMMTTFAAVMGAIPLTIGFGNSAPMHRGLGLVIAGGLIFSQGLTLLVTPIIYLYFYKLNEILKGKVNKPLLDKI